MQQIKKVGILSTAKFAAVYFAVFGLIFGIFFASIGNVISQVITEALTSAEIPVSNPFEGLVSFFWISAFTIAPLISAIFGFILGLIGAWVYNLTAKTGGLKIDIETEQDYTTNI